ncbi:MAG: XRE family transcriptional regulator [Clostridia bacterium]|nr:XRE family transcriptional regulator [Clostridia bacterium]
MIDLKLIGSRIRSLRLQSNMTQAEFAELLSVSFQAVSNWERGIAPPELDNLLRIATHFGVTTDDILRPKGDACYLGIDGGGTKTEFALVSSDGSILKRIIKNGCNPNDIGISEATALIRDVIKGLISEFPFLQNVFLGISGISVSNYAEILKMELKSHFPALNFTVKNDIFNLFAIDGGINMAIISGTGSVAFVRKAEEYRRIGGWGYLLDRAGSAYDIGRDAITLALSEEDALASPSYLSRKLREKLRATTVWEQLNTIYTQGKPYIADLASVVFDAYNEGDVNAAQIINTSAQALAKLLNIGVKVHGAEPIAIANGGLFSHYSDIMIQNINKYTDVKLITSELPPVYGACKMARTMTGDVISEEFYQNFKASYRIE